MDTLESVVYKRSTAADWQHLARQYEHPRDRAIHFDEPTHVYTVKNDSKGYISTTGFLHQFFGHFDADAIISKMMSSPKWKQSKYYGKTAEEIKGEWAENGRVASEAGTAMHLAIEMFLNASPQYRDAVTRDLPLTDFAEELAHKYIPQETYDTIEWKYFMRFWKKYGDDLEPYRTEWEVWVEEIRLSGSIDMIFRRKSDGKFLIYDWKRSKEIKTENRFQSGLGPVSHLPDSNYWHYSLQLNVYRWVLEKYYGLEIADMYLLILHPNAPSFKRIRLNVLEDEVEGMINCRRRALTNGLVNGPVEFSDE
jgi:ATP-dependent exoDNAse (exonuclease V) beta subunit